MSPTQVLYLLAQAKSYASLNCKDLDTRKCFENI